MSGECLGYNEVSNTQLTSIGYSQCPKVDREFNNTSHCKGEDLYIHIANHIICFISTGMKHPRWYGTILGALNQEIRFAAVVVTCHSADHKPAVFSPSHAMLWHKNAFRIAGPSRVMMLKMKSSLQAIETLSRSRDYAMEVKPVSESICGNCDSLWFDPRNINCESAHYQVRGVHSDSISIIYSVYYNGHSVYSCCYTLVWPNQINICSGKWLNGE